MNRGDSLGKWVGGIPSALVKNDEDIMNSSGWYYEREESWNK